MTCEELQQRVSLLERELALTQTDLGNAEVALRSERRAKQLARNQLANLKTTDPGARVVQGLLMDWQNFTGHERCDIRLDGERADRVRWALKSRDEDYIRQVFQAAGEFPYVWNYKRQRYGLKKDRRDDVTTLLRSERSMERLHDLLEDEPDERLVKVPARVIDEMKNRLEAARWAANIWKEQSQQDAELVSRWAAEVDAVRQRGRLRVVA